MDSFKKSTLGDVPKPSIKSTDDAKIPKAEEKVILGPDEWQCDRCTFINKTDWDRLTSAHC